MEIDKYEFTEEELEGYDISSFLHDFAFDNPEYNPSPEWARYEFECFKELYVIGGENYIYGFLGTKPTRQITQEDKITKIGFEENVGSGMAKRWVYDLKNKVSYFGDTTPVPMSDGEFEFYENIVGYYNIDKWDISTVIKKYEDHTGSYGYKLVFELEDGSLLAYNFYAQEMDWLPEEFLRLKRMLG